MIATTFSGRRLDILNLLPSQVSITDIAHHLSLCNRWAGGTHLPFSVAQHSILVAQLAPPEKKLRALLHDGSDYLLGDLMSPIKHHPRMAFFRELEKAVQDVIYEAFGCSKGEDDEVKAADRILQAMEARDLMCADPSLFGLPCDLPPAPLHAWPAAMAEDRFLDAFELFSRGKSRNAEKIHSLKSGFEA